MCKHHQEYALKSDNVNHPLLPRITNERVDKFFWGPYASQHLDSILDKQRIDDTNSVKITHWPSPGLTKPSFSEGLEGLGQEGKSIQKGYEFGPSWSNHWLKVEISIPKDIQSSNQEVIFEFDPGCEALIFSPDGTPLHAISGGPNTMKDGGPGEQEDRRVEHIIPSENVKKGKYEVIIEVGCNAMFGLGNGGYRYQTPDANRYFELVSADIVLPNISARQLRMDYLILLQISRQPELKTFGLSQRALKACDDIMNIFRREPGDEDDLSLIDDTVQRCRRIAWNVLGELDEKSLSESMTRSEEKKEGKIWAIGHCHIDTAWLWRYTQTQQKVARSWTTQCDIMDRYPNFQFAASSAQQYTWLEDLYPKGFDRVKKYIEQGRFHAVGGAWLEHDCMIPSGESLVRQYLYGQRYFKSKFGSYCREAWLPDTFGYASQLPQILRLAGLKYFFTQKISWNNINIFPYNSFNWAGIDGTQVLAHMTPVDGYNAQCNFPEVMKAITNNKNLGVTDQCLFLFGNGDGGGGPTPKMLEKLDRLDSVSKASTEIPSMKMGSPIEFFEDLAERTNQGKDLPTWKGELYLEYHRGTYTTQAAIKRGNRDMETKLRDLEYFATLASIMNKGYKYPKEELDECWKDTMLGQFHDCLPGTTIRTVVDDNIEIYKTRGDQTEKMIREALKALGTDERIKSAEINVIDPLRLSRDEVVEMDNGKLGRLITDEDGVGRVEVESNTSVKATAVESEGVYTIKNSRFSLSISNGRISSLKDISLDRELIAPGPGVETGGWLLNEDYPLRYDAWDVEVYHLKSARIINFDEIKTINDPLRSSLIAKAKFNKSTMTLKISLDATAPDAREGGYPKIEAHVDWHERHKILKFVLPVDINSAYATYGTQFGVIERPTHRNTTLDQAKFECCAHGFTDLSEANYGVAIASRDKYGYSVEGNTMRISCLRSSTSPDPEADQGEHNFEFAIIPHRGQLAGSNVFEESLRFNNKPRYISSPLKGLPTFKLQGCEGVTLETVKRGEDDSGSSHSIILRMYEAKGGRSRGNLIISGIDAASAEWVDILEEPLDGKKSDCPFEKKHGQTQIALNFGSFEIKTLKLVLA